MTQKTEFPFGTQVFMEPDVLFVEFTRDGHLDRESVEIINNNALALFRDRPNQIYWLQTGPLLRGLTSEAKWWFQGLKEAMRPRALVAYNLGFAAKTSSQMFLRALTFSGKFEGSLYYPKTEEEAWAYIETDRLKNPLFPVSGTDDKTRSWSARNKR